MGGFGNGRSTSERADVGVAGVFDHAPSRPRILLLALCAAPGVIVGVIMPSAAALVSVGVSRAKAMGDTGAEDDGSEEPTGSGEPDFRRRPKAGLSDSERRWIAFRDGVGDGRPVPLVAAS